MRVFLLLSSRKKGGFLSMGSEVCADEIMKEANMSSLKCKQGWIGPATPEEKGEHSINSSPLTRSDENDGLETPKETLFDSFAPASDKFLLAPHHRKYREDSRNHVVRRLDFFVEGFTTVSAAAAEIEIDIEIEEEERLFEIVYATIMDAIFAEQEQQPQPQPPPTPKSAPLLTGVADTCPAPPIKSARKQRFIDKEICRKLEF